MIQSLHRAPSAGALIKKIVEINPELSTPEVIQIIRQSLLSRGAEAGEFAGVERIDEEKALNLARLSIRGQS